MPQHFLKQICWNFPCFLYTCVCLCVCAESKSVLRKVYITCFIFLYTIYFYIFVSCRALKNAHLIKLTNAKNSSIPTKIKAFFWTIIITNLLFNFILVPILNICRQVTNALHYKMRLDTISHITKLTDLSHFCS